MQLIESGQESDWRQAIIEADIMLDELLNATRVPRRIDRRKAACRERAHFRTLNNAWDAHRVRNEIAHQGSRTAS
jgi:hypothetical protein